MLSPFLRLLTVEKVLTFFNLNKLREFRRPLILPIIDAPVESGILGFQESGIMSVNTRRIDYMKYLQYSLMKTKFCNFNVKRVLKKEIVGPNCLPSLAIEKLTAAISKKALGPLSSQCPLLDTRAVPVCGLALWFIEPATTCSALSV